MTPWRVHSAGAHGELCGHTVPRLSEPVAPAAVLSLELKSRLCTKSAHTHSPLLRRVLPYPGDEHGGQAELESPPSPCPTGVPV